MEYWNEEDNDIDVDFPPPQEPSNDSSTLTDEQEDLDSKTVIWWIVVFTCVFQTLHSLSERAVYWLLKFLFTLLTVMGRYSEKIARIAAVFPSTVYCRTQYLKKKLLTPTVCSSVVCQECHSLYDYNDCIERRGIQVIVKTCRQCAKAGKRIPLLKQVFTRQGTEKFYPSLVYPYSSLVTTLKSFFKRPNFLRACEEWRQSIATDPNALRDIYDGKLWKDFFCFEGIPFLSERNNIGLMLNVDWFQPFKHRTYSVGVLYLAVMNLPRNIRFKRENIIIVGVIPGPSEPPLTINTYLSPLVSELLSLWNDGIVCNVLESGPQVIRAALLCVACDLPAGRKTCGFLSYVANLGCSRCYANFGTGKFGVQNYSGFNRTSWRPRSIAKHREDVKTILKCTTKSEKQLKESEFGCRYSCLLELPYFDAIRKLIIDPMHNLYIGTAKSIMHNIWIKAGILDKVRLNRINGKMSTVIIPPNVKFGRLPSSIEFSKSFTAEQWMIWVNYYSLYCLYEELPPEHFECWRHFVLASRLLSKREVTLDDISISDALLLRFCCHFESLYGQSAVTPNMHMHCHLAECIRDYGPMSSFWLFSFERMNGILGNEPTNNRSIELQLMQRFVKDNSHLHLLSSLSNDSSDVSTVFSKVVKEHAYSYDSVKHLDRQISLTVQSSSGFQYVPAIKYTLAVFSESHIPFLSQIYCTIYPALSEQLSCTVTQSQTYRMMHSITICNQKINSGQFVYAKSVFPFQTSLSDTTQTVFTDPTYRPAKVHHFAIHSVQVTESSCTITHAFAVISWLMHHPLQHSIGKPYQVWHSSLYEYSPENFVVPLENISSLLITAECTFEDGNVIVVVPLL